MPDYGHELRFGVFIPPLADNPRGVIEMAQIADAGGLDYVTFQDHPYQPRFLDTWTLLSVVAAHTTSVRLAPNVANLPLRPPHVLARSVASLDRLSGGRIELGLGAGAFWDGVEAMGGPRRTAKESVDALEEAVAILRQFWSGERSVHFDGDHYRVKGAHPGPPVERRIGIWLGAYGPRMLRMTGRLADGWLPSLGSHYLAAEDVPRGHAAIDQAARRAGRDPAAIERALNVMALGGEPTGWADQLARIAIELRFTTLFVSVPAEDPVGFVRRLGEDVAPRVRELVGAVSRGE
jgi:alkanesulfonate monooxygenase SsuD/methylene tetrahydromethanopterin reductase-like flavin-dependent oxidoreductase (luciferase family)